MMEGARGTIEAVAIKNLQEVLRKNGISAEALFSKYDLDGNGSLSENEFAAALESITGQQAPAAILRAVFGALDTNSDGSVDLPEILAMMEGDSTESVPAGEGVSISDHPNESYNGEYDLQDIQINGKALYKSARGNRLYFYNANSGGAPSWSLDDREQDGSNDWYRGGWSRSRGDGSLPTGTRRWVGVGKITISVVGESSESTADDTASRAAKNFSGDEQIKITLPRSSFKSGEKISFSFTTFELPNDAWIGIVPAEIPHGDEAVNDQHETSYEYLEGRTHGSFTLPNPGLGEWTLRLHDTDNNGRELAYVPFTVATDGTPSSPPDFDAGKSEFDMVTDNFTELISKLEQSVSDQGLSVEQAREIANSEVEKEIEKLPFSIQSAARRIWRIRANSVQEQIVSRMSSPEAIAAGAAAVGVAGVVAADMQENAEEAP
ncbi:MAG: EF-hand domain-containing protein, partial [Candidatus Poseidoniales archaeon]|nr:EF-hand domain-containing protein [Candidatus Poseidoniales archaeon]